MQSQEMAETTTCKYSHFSQPFHWLSSALNSSIFADVAGLVKSSHIVWILNYKTMKDT